MNTSSHETDENEFPRFEYGSGRLSWWAANTFYDQVAGVWRTRTLQRADAAWKTREELDAPDIEQARRNHAQALAALRKPQPRR